MRWVTDINSVTASPIDALLRSLLMVSARIVLSQLWTTLCSSNFTWISQVWLQVFFSRIFVKWALLIFASCFMFTSISKFITFRPDTPTIERYNPYDNQWTRREPVIYCEKTSLCIYNCAISTRYPLPRNACEKVSIAAYWLHHNRWLLSASKAPRVSYPWRA